MICSGSSYANIVTVKYSGSSGSKIKRWQTLHRALSSSLSRVAPDKSRFILPEQQALFPKGFKAAVRLLSIEHTCSEANNLVSAKPRQLIVA